MTAGKPLSCGRSLRRNWANQEGMDLFWRYVQISRKRSPILLLSIEYVTISCAFVPTANKQKAQRGLFHVPSPHCRVGTGGSVGRPERHFPSFPHTPFGAKFAASSPESSPLLQWTWRRRTWEQGREIMLKWDAICSQLLTCMPAPE